MDSQDFSDSSDENDSDYNPIDEDEKLSEVDSDDQIEDDEDSVSTSAKKSKRTNKKPTTKKKNRGSIKKSNKVEIDDEAIEKTKEEVNTLLNSSEDDKKRLDALWEEFQRPIKKKTSNTPTTSENKSKPKESLKVYDKPETTKKRNLEELFDSSESSKKVDNNYDNRTIIPKSPEIKNEVASIATKPSGGLANILSQIGKKSKLTVLEKSKQDWDGYKKNEGIVEELVTYNKGKNGYLEKQDFLERTDLRQFELEKAMRAANRSHRS